MLPTEFEPVPFRLQLVTLNVSHVTFDPAIVGDALDEDEIIAVEKLEFKFTTLYVLNEFGPDKPIPPVVAPCILVIV
jgi:hypothetical protein